MAPETGLEPVTRRLTAGCSTIELLWNSRTRNLPAPISTVNWIRCTPKSRRPSGLIRFGRLLVLFFPFLVYWRFWGAFISFLTLGHHNRQQDRDKDNAADDHQGNRGWNIDLPPVRIFGFVGVDQHLDTDKNQDEGESIFQKPEIFDCSLEHEVKGAQPKDREHVRREDNKRTFGHCKDCRDGVQSKEQVGRFDHQQDERQRSQRALALPGGDEFLSIEH